MATRGNHWLKDVRIELPAMTTALSVSALGSIDFTTYRAVRIVLLAVSVTIAIIVWRRANRSRRR